VLHGSAVDRVSSALTTPCPLISRTLHDGYSFGRVSNRLSSVRRIASDNLSDTPLRPRLSRVSSSADQTDHRVTTGGRRAHDETVNSDVKKIFIFS